MCYTVIHQITDLDDILHGFTELQEMGVIIKCYTFQYILLQVVG